MTKAVTGEQERSIFTFLTDFFTKNILWLAGLIYEADKPFLYYSETRLCCIYGFSSNFRTIPLENWLILVYNIQMYDYSNTDY